VPKDWGLTLYLSDRNKNLLKDVDFGRETQIIILPDHKLNNPKYNKLLKSIKFCDSLPYDKVLIFQTDSRLLREGIEEFLEWDYVGSPWKFQEHGGNGGLSLRSVEIMKHIVNNYKFSPRNEDALICNIMKDKNIGKLAPRDICSKFGVETIFQLGTLGCHAIDKWLTNDECKQVLNQYK
jgi:hypothetical protein